MPEYLAPGVFVEETTFQSDSFDFATDDATGGTTAAGYPTSDNEWKYTPVRRTALEEDSGGDAVAVEDLVLEVEGFGDIG